jgi:hypothetical protein
MSGPNGGQVTLAMLVGASLEGPAVKPEGANGAGAHAGVITRKLPPEAYSL